VRRGEAIQGIQGKGKGNRQEKTPRLTRRTKKDNTIVATAIPRIADEFGALDKVGWYGAAYIMTMCATQLPFGKLYTLYPVKTVFLCAIAVFEIGSVVCGAAPTSNALIAGRAVAGVGGAGVFQGAMVIIPYIVPVSSRPACKLTWQRPFWRRPLLRWLADNTPRWQTTACLAPSTV
jgi:MFS family permease